jgi:hypothetical protein
MLTTTVPVCYHYRIILTPIMIASTETAIDNSMANTGDLSLVHKALDVVEDNEGVDHSSGLDSFLRFPISDTDSSTSSLPTLDQVSVCSEEDDDSSLSSNSFTDEPESLENGRRSIFSQYWMKVGGAPSIRREHQPFPLFAEEIMKSESERTDKIYEEGDSETHSSSASDNSRRRNIFNKTCWSQSLPSLTSVSNSPERKLRKIQSSFVHQHRKPKQSCLRLGRFSSDQLLPASSSSSVHFDPHADVQVFSPPVEMYASVGWSAWFA